MEVDQRLKGGLQRQLRDLLLQLLIDDDGCCIALWGAALLSDRRLLLHRRLGGGGCRVEIGHLIAYLRQLLYQPIDTLYQPGSITMYFTHDDC